MKKIALVGAALLLAVGAQAQMNVRVGAEAGLNLANMKYQETDLNGGIPKTSDKSGDIKIGAKAGVVLDLGFNNSLSLQPGLFYSMKGFKSNSSSEYDFLGATAEQTEKYSNTIHYLELPINLHYRFGDEWSNTRFMIYAGPYAAYAIAGQHKGTSKLSVGGTEIVSIDTSRALTFGNTSTEIDMNDPFNPVTKNGDDLRALDFGFQVGAGVEMNSGLYFKAQYQMGMANLANDYSVKGPGFSQSGSGQANNWCIGISVGYFFMNGNNRY